VKAGAYAVRRFGADTLILDDGFQYLKLKDHLQVLLVDKSNPFGNGRLLPRGILREPISHMRRASYVLLTKSDGLPNPELEAMIKRYKPQLDLIECEHRPRYLRSLDGKEERPLESLEGDAVGVFSAIAAPQSFEGFVEKYGAEIVSRQRFLDHHWFSEEDLADIFREAVQAGARYVVTTEKDAVRIDPAYRAPLPCFFLRVEIGILSGARDFEEAVSRICFPKKEIRPSRPPFGVRRA
jgi:tetraacyldisaccharide 4'-kinase